MSAFRFRRGGGTSAAFDFHARSSISETLDIVERGLRRLGIDPHGRPHELARNTMASREDRYQRQKKAAIRRRGAYTLTELHVERIKELHAQGKFQGEIAHEIGCSQGAVAKRLLKLGFRKLKTRRMKAA